MAVHVIARCGVQQCMTVHTGCYKMGSVECGLLPVPTLHLLLLLGHCSSIGFLMIWISLDFLLLDIRLYQWGMATLLLLLGLIN